MRTFYFFRYESHTYPPVIKTFTVEFEENGAQIHPPNEIVHGVYILDANGRILERTDGENHEIPVVQSLRDNTLLTFDTLNASCIASANRYIIDTLAGFFRHGFNEAVRIVGQQLKEIQEANPIHPLQPPQEET